MEIRLKQEWLGHPIGAIVKVSDDCANSLFQRDAGEKMEPESNGAIKEKLQRMVANKFKQTPMKK
jgi:hypothetical protein